MALLALGASFHGSHLGGLFAALFSGRLFMFLSGLNVGFLWSFFGVLEGAFVFVCFPGLLRALWVFHFCYLSSYVHSTKEKKKLSEPAFFGAKRRLHFFVLLLHIAQPAALLLVILTAEAVKKREKKESTHWELLKVVFKQASLALTLDSLKVKDQAISCYIGRRHFEALVESALRPSYFSISKQPWNEKLSEFHWAVRTPLFSSVFPFGFSPG